ncbi:MAG: TIM barrel protein [Micromonosporaceae bacterium]
MRLAGAPISWGVCEVPGWGWQLSPGRVLGEMAELGLTAAEFGPDGFLPDGGVARRDALAAYGLAAVGGFVPLVLHDPHRDPVPAVRRALAMFAAAGATTLVLAAATGRDGYEARPDLDAAGWAALLSNLDRIDTLARDAGVSATLHPHVGTMIERPDEIDRVLDGCGIGLCLDTGHVLVGGGDPVALARRAPQRIRHVHLKDVDAATATRVRAGEIGYRDAVATGLYRPLGAGDVGIADIVATLTAAGYTGWYVLEQDLVLDAAPPPGRGPVEQVRRSLEYLRGLAR